MVLHLGDRYPTVAPAYPGLMIVAAVGVRLPITGGTPMTKEQLITKMALSAGISKVAAGTALNAFTGAVMASLKKGQRVTLVNFGTFGIARRKARAGRMVPMKATTGRRPGSTVQPRRMSTCSTAMTPKSSQDSASSCAG